MEELKNKLKIYIDNNLINAIPHKMGFFGKLKSIIKEDYCEEEFECGDSYYEVDTLKTPDNTNIKDYIDKHEDYNDFQTMLFKFIDNKNLKDSDVYNRVHIDRRLFSKIRSDKNYHPSKETIILLAIALELTENELDELLESASYSLPKNNKYDLIIRFCFINKIFRIPDINELLYEYNCKLFNY